MGESFREFVDKLKREVDLVAEINKTPGMAMQDRRRGKYVYGQSKAAGGPGDSLMVDVGRQTYTWWQKGGHRGKKGDAYGDVIDWLETYRKMDFMDAVKYLCREYNVALPPDFDREPRPEMVAFRQRMALWDVVAKWLGERLLSTAAAMDYARGRGWTDETIEKARLGFSPGGRGERLEEIKRDLRGDLQMHEYDPECPEAVAVLGLSGGKEKLQAWAARYEVDIEAHPNWLEKGRIYGMLDFPRLVYTHIRGDKVVYFSCRNLQWDNKRLMPVSGKYKTWNMPRVLVGERKHYANFEYYSSAERVVVCEGPADAVTWAQWGVAAWALAGVAMDDDLAEKLRKHDVRFWGLDNGPEGQEAVDAMGPRLGADSWVIHFPLDEDQGEDANDYLQAMIEQGVKRTDVAMQRKKAERLLKRAELFALRAARKAGQTTGPDRVEAVEQAGALIKVLPEAILSQYHKPLRKALDFGVRELDRVLRNVTTDNGSKGTEDKVGVETTLGGKVFDWVLEYCYDPETEEAILAYRNPKGDVGLAHEVVIEGIKYIPKPPNKMVKSGGVLFPSTLGEKRSTRDLIEEVELFINRYYLLDDAHLVRIIAYYVLLTWIYDAFEALPYLRALGDYGSGKSELMKRVGYICYRRIAASGANTSATFFRTKEMYNGTVYIDEADLHDGGDMSNDIIKFLNLGAMKGTPITRMVETVDYYGNKVLEPTPFDTFGPKLIAMREDFRDKAVGSRSLTINVVSKETEELMEAGIPLHINDVFRQHALTMRNRLLRWRLENFVDQIELTDDLMDMHLSPRLNQVTMAVKSLAKLVNDHQLMDEITTFLRAYALEEIYERSLSVPAYLVEAIWELWNNDQNDKTENLYVQNSRDGRLYFWMADIRERANMIMDALNEAGSVREEDVSKSKGELTPQGVGHYIRDTLQLEVGRRQGSGVPVYWDKEKMVRLGKKYGVLEQNYGEGADGADEPEEPKGPTAEQLDLVG